MKAVVTGATGFLGGHLCRALLDRGYEVTALGRNQTVGDTLTACGASFMAVDLSVATGLNHILNDADYIFHCAALSSPWGNYIDFYKANVVATRNLLDGAMSAGVKRFVHVSSPSLYFDFRDRLNIAESSILPSKQVNNYAQTKRLAEREVDRAFAAGLPTITLRPRAIFGPGDTAIIPRLLRANREKFIPLPAHGDVVVDMTYVGNVVQALLLCIDTPSTNLGRKYNITNGEPVQLRSFLEALFKDLDENFNSRNIPVWFLMTVASLSELFYKYLLRGREPVLTRYSAGTLVYSQTLDITKAQEELGYEPGVSLDAGRKEMVRWLRSK